MQLQPFTCVATCGAAGSVAERIRKYCRSTRDLEYDHMVPVSRGGSNTEKNIELLCRKCNRKKGPRIALDDQPNLYPDD
jgi:5-methylcytosine-specific restriction endonuclease McrA